MSIVETDAGLRRSGFRGAVVEPGDERWDAARRAYNLMLDQRPELIAFPVDERDVAAVVRFARERGLRIAPQRTGHNAGPLGSLEGTVLLKTDGLQEVAIDARTRRARVAAGATWGDVVPHASGLGLGALHGSTPTVSVVGYSLGGGIGWYARRHGLAANSVTAIEIVTADGRLRRVDHEHEPELFWALRGGGGNFGVVTAIEFDLFPIERVYAGVLFFPWERSCEVLHAWHEWVDAVPDELTSVGRILRFPPLPEIPTPLRGESFAIVEAAYLGDERDGVELLRPLRELRPAMDTFATVPPVSLSELHMDPPDPVAHVSETQLLGQLPPAAIDRLVATAGPDSGSSLTSVELRHAGGALARGAEDHGALSTLAGSFVMFGLGVPGDLEAAAAMEAQLARVADGLAAHDVGRYANFTVEEVSAARFFPDETCRRLAAIKAEYDPEGLFRANHSVGQRR